MEAAQEIASILNSQLSSEEKSMLLDAYWNDDISSTQEINKCSTSSHVDLEDKTQHKDANTKEDNDVISEWKDESPSLSSSQQDKTQHKEAANTKEDNDVISEWKDESSSLSSSQQSKAKRALDPLIIDEISSILKSDLTWEDKSSRLAAILFNEDISPSKDKMATTSQEVKLQEKTQDSEGKKNGGRDNLLNDGTSEKIDEHLSSHSPKQEAKANEALQSELNLKEKSANSGTDQKDSPSPEEDTSSTTSSKIKLEEIGQLTDAKESRRVAPEESRRIFVENEVFTVKESNSNSDGKEDEISIHKQEAACKHCHKLMFEEFYMLRAKCGCTSSLIHEECANAWSQEKGDKCSYCEQEIQNKEVTLSIPPQTSGENSDIPSSTSKRYWCCFS